MKSPLHFFVRVLALMPVTFLAWHLLSPVIAGPCVWAVSLLLPAWLPGVVEGVYLDGTLMQVVAALGESGGRFLPAEQAGNQLAFNVDTRTLSYSIPFFAALHFAAPIPGRWELFARSVLVLWVLMIPGLVSTALKDMLVTFGGQLLAQPAVPPANAIALAYQFNTLIVPPLAPVLLWGLVARHSPAVRGLFPALYGGSQPAPGED